MHLGVWQTTGRALLRVYPFAALAGLWVLVSSFTDVSPLVLPEPSRIISSAMGLVESGALWQELSTTLWRIIVSFVFAVFVGTLVGLAMAAWAVVNASLRPLIAYFFPTPKVALYPGLLIFFGVGTGSVSSLGFLEALFPVLLASFAAASGVDQKLIWSARSLGASSREVAFAIVFRAAMPGIMAGARIAIVGALAGVFIAELIAGGSGLGHAAVVSWRLLNVADMFVYVMVFALVGFALDRLFLVLRKRVLFWTPEEDLD